MKLFLAKVCLASLAVLIVSACHQPPATTAPPAPTATPAPTPYQLSEAGLQFELPAGWMVSKAGSDTVVITSPDNELSVSFIEPAEKERKVAELLSVFNKDHHGIKKGAIRQGAFNGLPHTSQSGEATNTVTNKTFEWSIDTLAAKKPLIVYSQVNHEAKEKYRQDYEKLINSLRPIQ